MAQETQPVHDVKNLIRIRGGHKAAFTKMEMKIDLFKIQFQMTNVFTRQKRC